MVLHRIIIGIQLNKKIFRLSTVGGALTDEILALKDSDSNLGKDYFTQVSSSNSIENLNVSFLNEEGTNKLQFLPDQVILRKAAPCDKSSVNIDKTIQQFEAIWKKSDKVIAFPGIRRIGIVAEFRINEENSNSAANQLVKALLKVPSPKHSGTFQLTFEDRKLNSDNTIPDKQLGDFWNTIYTYYLSEKDEKPDDGKIVASIDVQKYYNPAKSNMIAELKNVKRVFTEEKKKFKASLKEMGLA